MFDDIFIERLKKAVIFFIIFTGIYIIFFATLPYTFPFVIAIIIAIIMKPITNFFIKKLKLSRALASFISTMLVFIVLFFLVITILFKITSEVKLLLESIPSKDKMADIVMPYVYKLKEYYDAIDPSLISKVESKLTSILSGSLDITVKLVNKLLSIAISLPMIMMMIFVTFLATFFFSRDIGDVKDKVLCIFSDKGRDKVKRIWNEGINMIVGYIRAYSILLSLTFLESWLGFSILGVKYALILSIVCAIFDILPIVGIGAVFTPLTIIYLISGRYLIALGLVITYIAMTLIRQVLEPKLISVSLGLHPVAVLAAIFIGIKAYGFLGMIYLISLMVLYNIIKKVNTL